MPGGLYAGHCHAFLIDFFTGSNAHSAKQQYLSYSEGDFDCDVLRMGQHVALMG